MIPLFERTRHRRRPLRLRSRRVVRNAAALRRRCFCKMPAAVSKPRIVPAPIIVVACFVIAALVHHLFPMSFSPDFGYLWPGVGILLCVASLAIGISGVREFHRHNTPSNPFKPTRALVTSGIFRHTRNPMYLGFVLLACAVAVALNSVAFPATAVLLALFLQVLVIAEEERAMSESFGEAFQSYCRSTRRWI